MLSAWAQALFWRLYLDLSWFTFIYCYLDGEWSHWHTTHLSISMSIFVTNYSNVKKMLLALSSYLPFLSWRAEILEICWLSHLKSPVYKHVPSSPSNKNLKIVFRISNQNWISYLHLKQILFYFKNMYFFIIIFKNLTEINLSIFNVSVALFWIVNCIRNTHT